MGGPVTTRRQRGFTLVEALVTTVILGVGMAGLAKFHADVMESSGHIKAGTEGLALAQQKLEELRNYTAAFPYTSLDSGTETGITGTLADYTVSWTITPAVMARYYDVSVSTSWTDLDGAQTVTLHSWISSLPPVSAGRLLAESAP